MTADTRKFVDEFKRIGAENVNLDDLINKFSDVDSTIVETAKKVKQGNIDISDLDLAMQNAATKGSQFTATLKTIAANALPILAISAVIQLIQASWDAVNVTVEEQEAKVSSLQAAYQNLSSEYEQLSGKQDLTEAEKSRLSYLERRLELDERILKAEQSQLFEEKTGSKFTDLFDKDNMKYLEKQLNCQLRELASAYNDTATSAIAASAANRISNGRGDYETILSDMMASIKRQTGSFKIEFDPIKSGKTFLHPARIQKHIIQSPFLYCGGLQAGRLMKQKNQPTTKPKRRNFLWTILRWNQRITLRFQPKAPMIFQKL